MPGRELGLIWRRETVLELRFKALDLLQAVLQTCCKPLHLSLKPASVRPSLALTCHQSRTGHGEPLQVRLKKRDGGFHGDASSRSFPHPAPEPWALVLGGFLLPWVSRDGPRLPLGLVPEVRLLYNLGNTTGLGGVRKAAGQLCRVWGTWPHITRTIITRLSAWKFGGVGGWHLLNFTAYQASVSALHIFCIVSCKAGIIIPTLR